MNNPILKLPSEHREHFERKLESFFQGCQEITKKYHRLMIEHANKTSNNHPLPENLHDEYWKLSIGKRYAKISKGGSVLHNQKPLHGGSVHCFVDLDNGDVLKPASWSKPAKHARGNIFDESNGLKLMGPYGPAYLR